MTKSITIRLYFSYKGKLYERYFNLIPPDNIKNNYEQQEAFVFGWGDKKVREWFKEETGEEYNGDIKIQEKFLNKNTKEEYERRI